MIFICGRHKMHKPRGWHKPLSHTHRGEHKPFCCVHINTSRRTNNTTHIPEKILGVTFDNKLIFQNHITERKKHSNIYSQYTPIFQTSPLKLQLELFNTLSFSQYTFSSTPLLYQKDLGLKTGQILQNKAIRLAYNIHWTEHKANREIHET